MTKDNDKGHAVSESIDNSCHGVASPRPFGHHRHPRLTATAGIAVSHEDGSLFVACENQRDIVLLVESVEQREYVVTRQCCDELNPLRLEDINDRICNTHDSSNLLG